MHLPDPEIITEMNRLIDAARDENLHMRVIGGLAVRIHSPNVRQRFGREYPDIDFVVSKQERRRLDEFFQRMGYEPDRNFNLLNGDRRQIFYDTHSGRHVDIFVGDFEMCHKLPLRDRLQVHPITVPLADLFLSKSQIVELNRKDALDLISLLLENNVGADDTNSINMERITRLFARDWGLYKTTSINLDRIEKMVRFDDLGLSADDRQTVLARIDEMRRALSCMRKSLLWHVRDRVGTRLRWYTDVEEVRR